VLACATGMAGSDQEVHCEVDQVDLCDEVSFPSLWYPVLAVGLAMVGFIAIKTGRDTLFFSRPKSLQTLPWAYLWISLGSAGAAALHLAAMQRFGARRTRVGLMWLVALASAAVVPFYSPDARLLASVLFVAIPVVFAAVFAGAWLLAGDLFDGAPSAILRKVYTRIGAGSMVGGILGGLTAKGVALVLPASALFAVGALMLGGVGLVCVLAHRRHSVDSLQTPDARPAADQTGETDQASSPRPSRGVMRELLSRPLVRLLLGISSLATVAAMFIEFQFYAAVALSGNSSPQFFGSFYLLLNLASLVLQLQVAPRLQGLFGVAGTLLILPLGVLGAAGTVTAWSTLITCAVLRVTEGGLKSSIHRSVWEQVFLPIERERRGPAKVLVDGMVARLAEAAGAAALLWWVSSRSMHALSVGWISWTVLGATLLWLLLTVAIRRRVPPMPEVDLQLRLPDS
jgi:AAA family ATP:ADP antiporter